MKSALTKIVILSLSIICFVTCGWRQLRSSVSPNRKWSISIEGPNASPNLTFRVVATNERESRVIYSQQRDFYMTLVEFSWPEGSELGGVLICNGFSHFEPLLFAVDFDTLALRESTFVKEGLTRQIRLKYRVPKEVDPLRWACSVDGERAFRQQPVNP
ncbi:MAG: hypothetical protein NTZ94_14935 [Verrucomicrobia bacterium]|nr:hypothetical protein [Verrucomicrobiota bacterium]